MNLLRRVTMIAGLTVLLVNTGDCVNLLFADQKAAECCLREDCPLAAAGQMDSCCAKPVSPGKYIQAVPQKSLSQPVVKQIEFPAGPIDLGLTLSMVAYSQAHRKVHSPPGSLNSLSTPLLI
jgi:hypothetical protein